MIIDKLGNAINFLKYQLLIHATTNYEVDLVKNSVLGGGCITTRFRSNV